LTIAFEVSILIDGWPSRTGILASVRSSSLWPAPAGPDARAAGKERNKRNNNMTVKSKKPTDPLEEARRRVDSLRTADQATERVLELLDYHGVSEIELGDILTRMRDEGWYDEEVGFLEKFREEFEMDFARIHHLMAVSLGARLAELSLKELLALGWMRFQMLCLGVQCGDAAGVSDAIRHHRMSPRRLEGDPQPGQPPAARRREPGPPVRLFDLDLHLGTVIDHTLLVASQEASEPGNAWVLSGTCAEYLTARLVDLCDTRLKVD
jgi:hypothetical protein